jgi:hypothetical protein
MRSDPSKSPSSSRPYPKPDGAAEPFTGSSARRAARYRSPRQCSASWRGRGTSRRTSSALSQEPIAEGDELATDVQT